MSDPSFFLSNLKAGPMVQSSMQSSFMILVLFHLMPSVSMYVPFDALVSMCVPFDALVSMYVPFDAMHTVCVLIDGLVY